jgi:hypothetical protein
MRGCSEAAWPGGSTGNSGSRGTFSAVVSAENGKSGARRRICHPGRNALRTLPCGTLVDGALVVLRQGRANLDALLRRHQLKGRCTRRLAGLQIPARYVVFDVLRLHRVACHALWCRRLGPF